MVAVVAVVSMVPTVMRNVHERHLNIGLKQQALASTKGYHLINVV
ncbi:hypothetical protein imdm_2313 [gamma proteobacterium IMCC2047]|nr:hypothetical protein imdm_2313 [gamma proteobacterium IMCC2047]